MGVGCGVCRLVLKITQKSFKMSNFGFSSVSRWLEYVTVSLQMICRVRGWLECVTGILVEGNLMLY